MHDQRNGADHGLAVRPLTAIATELRHEVEQAEQHWQSAVQHAIRAGELLTEAKGQVKHGEWLPWLEANFPGSERTARNYMRLAANSATVADLPTVREAIGAITSPKSETPNESRKRDFEVEARAMLLKRNGGQILGSTSLYDAEVQIQAGLLARRAAAERLLAMAPEYLTSAPDLAAASAAAGAAMIEEDNVGPDASDREVDEVMTRAGDALDRWHLVLDRYKAQQEQN